MQHHRSMAFLREHSHKMNSRHEKQAGGQITLQPEEERKMCEALVKTAEWGYPMDYNNLRYLTKAYLDKRGIQMKKFSNNLPSSEWATGFIKRHSNLLSTRICQNISPKRASVPREAFQQYFDNLQECVDGVPPQNIVNFDETNVSDDPGTKKCIFKRGVKYPERVIQNKKSCVSLMFCGSASGCLLPVYIVYKAEHLWSSWCQGGPPGSRANNTSHGWFDAATFLDWFKTIYLPYAKTLEGVKVIIGDNLASHFSEDVIRLAEQNNIRFVCLPPNTTHLAQPLDVAYFGPLKRKWREILTEWRQQNPRSSGGIPKDTLPRLLNKLWYSLQENSQQNLIAGFKATGICPFDPQKILDKLPAVPDPETGAPEVGGEIESTFVSYLQSLRHPTSATRQQRRKRINIEPGKSVTIDSFQTPGMQASSSGTHTGSRNKPGKKRRAVSVPESEESDQDDVEDDLEHNNGNSSDEIEMEDHVTQAEAQAAEEDLHLNDYVLVKFATKKTVKYYVGEIIGLQTHSEYKIKFMRKVVNDDKRFVFPEADDIGIMGLDDIVRKVPSPASPYDRRDGLVFNVSFAGYNIM